ncbi:MAG: sodium-dependent bicarbonate transport family permease [Rhodospirillales bacterium]|nr:sodium-dependent bicarbonate transport family permease [Rhodospirillales bacterium]MBO6788576.1 sodium-dependent bicarbonate transport family permease [Rhodospirillales bacterium]
MDLALATLLSPPVLFFVLGLIGALATVDVRVSENFSKAISLYLLAAIGLKGGVAISNEGIAGILAAAAFGIILSFAMPVIAYALLRRLTAFDRREAGAIAAHYGSISIVTFIAASTLLGEAGVMFAAGMVAVAALMEAPAIASGLALAGRGGLTPAPGRDILKVVVFNESIYLILGAMVIGTLIGKDGGTVVAPFFFDPLQGVLCLFLLDMGLKTGDGLRRDRRVLSAGSLTFGILMPVIGASLGLAAANVAGLSVGNAVLLMTLAASASYIAVPAAMRIAMPDVNPAIYTSLSLGVTFPFNLIVGIPVYLLAAEWVLGG